MHFSIIEKLGASVLIVAWLIYGTNVLGNILVHVEEHASTMEVHEKAGGEPPAAEAPAAPIDIMPLIAAADPAAGEKAFGKCKACHTVAKGGPNGVGPNLWNVVGGPHAHIEGFNYSSVMAGMHDKTWTYEELSAFLTDPKAYAPGTKMVFVGLKKPEERAAVIAYLRSQSDNPLPLP